MLHRASCAVREQYDSKCCLQVRLGVLKFKASKRQTAFNQLVSVYFQNPHQDLDTSLKHKIHYWSQRNITSHLREMCHSLAQSDSEEV